MPNKTGERIKSRREELDLSQAELARLCNWPTASRLGNYELGNRKISAEDATVLAGALKVSPSYLLFGDNDAVVFNDYRYPVYTAAQLLQLSLAQLALDKTGLTLSTSIRASRRAFWFEVAGHSMTAPLGARPSFPEGMMVFCEPECTPEPGEFCLVKLIREKEIVFKRYSKEDGKSWLEPLNTASRYEPIAIDDSVEVIGKIKSAIWPPSHFE
jgi:SOS-response transcriptional repressor LexA